MTVGVWAEGGALPYPGQILYLDRGASIQFDGDRALVVEVLKVLPRPLFAGWLWLDVVVLRPVSTEGELRRKVFVQANAVIGASRGLPISGY